MLRRDHIRAMTSNHGPEGFLGIMAGLIAKARKVDQVTGQVTHGGALAQFSIRALWEALVGPVEETLSASMHDPGFIRIAPQFLNALTSTAFPSAVGQLIAAKVIEGYTTPGFIGDQLCEIMPSTMKDERVVGFTALQGPKVVLEGQQYEDSSIAEKYVTAPQTKRGRLLSVNEETVTHDQTGQILLLAQNIGLAAREERERRIVRGVADVVSTTRVYYPSGTGGQLYVDATYHNLLATATPLVDWTDIQDVLAYHAVNQRDDRQTDDENATQPITWRPTVLLTAQELAGTAALIVNAVNPTTMVNAPNMAQQLVPGLVALSSPYLDAAQGADQFADASDWFLGNFKRQFKYKEIWPLQTFAAAPDSEDRFKRDVVACYKVREYGDLFAVDHKHVVQVNAV